MLGTSLQEQAKIRDNDECVIGIDIWSLSISEVENTYDGKENVIINTGQTPPFYHIVGFCKPTILAPYPMVWFPQDFPLVFWVHSFIGRMSSLNDHYSLETQTFFDEK